jgi:rRNA maturation protein Rpf1
LHSLFAGFRFRYFSSARVTERIDIFFAIRSISKNNLTLYFKSSIVALNHKRDNQSDPNNPKTRISIFENSTTTEGFMNIDPNTHLIYSIQATTTRKMESHINEGNKRTAIIISRFALYNAIE